MRRDPFVRGSRLSGALEHVLRRALLKQKLARREFDAEPIHDLRVALRRCSSLAEGFSEMDPWPVWRELRKACRKQQRGLGELRDAQVMAQWVRRLGMAQGTSAATLKAALDRRERRARRKARSSLESFPRKRWKHWLHTVPAHAAELPVGESRLAKIAFERLTDVCLLERRWRKTRGAARWHRLRVAVKRFRYAVESFLPAQHAAWGRDLKRLQNWLGEGHDLDVLRLMIPQLAREESLPQADRERWFRKIADARLEKTARYARAVSLVARSRTPASRGGRPGMHTSKHTFLWDRWRVELGVLAKVSPADAAGRARSTARLR
jgi:CHAD domain-containing protein